VRKGNGICKYRQLAIGYNNSFGARLLDNAIRRAPLFNFHFSIFNWTKASEQGTWPVVGGGNADIHNQNTMLNGRN
jgi:hypothetical protein